MKKILLTGAGGFIGQHTIPFLLKKGYEVHAVDIVKKPSQIIKSKKLFWHECDVLDLSAQKRLCAEINATHLLHFAWYAVPGKYWTSLENLAWVKASLDLLINFKKQEGKRAVLAGTCAEYDWDYGYCSEEITPIRPQMLYGTCKNSLQQILSQFSKQAGINSAWGRIFFVYGPYEHPSRFIPYVICSLLQDKPAQCKHGNQIRDFLHVQDVASAFVSLLESNVTGPVNIASGTPIALKDAVNTIADKLNKRDLVRFRESPSPLKEPRLLVAEVKRLNSEVSWKPSYDLERGLEQTIDWWKNQRKVK